MGMPACQECMDAGWRMVDGKPSACACAVGDEWAKRAYPGGTGPWTPPNSLPPGGDVLVRQAAREAAGLPVGALDGDHPVRALLIDDALVQAALGHISALASEVDEDHPARKAAVAFLDALPPQYRQTVPPLATPTRKKDRGRAAVPLTPPPS